MNVTMMWKEIWYKDFKDFSEEFTDTLVILVTYDYWIWVINEGEDSFGVASFSAYTCHTEEHRLTKDQAISEIHEVASKILDGKLR